jgi:hypothetical protein
MRRVLEILEVFLTNHTSYYYQVRDHFRGNNEMYSIDLFLGNKDDRVVISSTIYDDIIEVWTTKQLREDGVRILKKALLEYLYYIIKSDFDD